ncbi:MAG: hypothetical protein P8Z67_16260 [Gammaproteobacteria bacterium]
MSRQQNWYVKNLGDALLAGSELERVKALFQADYDKAQDPGKMAIFMRHESEGRLHCDVVIYFPPATEMLARRLNAASCPAPAPRDLGLLVGADQAWTTLFREY